jgi:hypothetical protein
MLNSGVDVDTRDPGGMTPLMGAASGGHLEVITMQLIRRADIEATDEEGITALAHAVYHSRLEAARLLLDQGANANGSGLNCKRVRRVETKLRDGTIKPEDLPEQLKQPQGYSPLAYAVFHQDTALAELLLDRGADINAPNGVTGNTPLASAALAGKTAMVRVLLERGADTTARDKRGHTALELARRMGKSNEVIALLEAHEDRPGPS